MNKPAERATLSVGLNMNFAGDEELNAGKLWLQLNLPHTDVLINHIQTLEAIIDVEKYATLSVMAGELRDHLSNSCELSNKDLYRHGFQAAISMVVSAFEDIDLESNGATSIAEIQAATVRHVQTLCKNNDDYQALGNYAKAIIDGAQ